MNDRFTDDEFCQYLIGILANVFPDLSIEGGADEPFYQAAKDNAKAVIYFRDNYPRSLLHELSHYCLAGDRRRMLDDFGYWYSPCGRSEEEQNKFEMVEARPQGLEKVMCEILKIKFSASIDDFSGRPPSDAFLQGLEAAYQEMQATPPPTALKVLNGFKNQCTQ
ncbi:elongation factor P hydroxylase [Psychromonas sp. SP041]|uniref:elongation factor P hydroxylase n=1 Tax=Psychromonas sp. SP041 TaxID=1365007 RepID=UPI0004023121|nr:elongation factor P hydroxylase [Psychromonas sp. SP041]